MQIKIFRLILAGLIFASLNLAESAAPFQRYGINSGLETDAIADKVQDLNVKWVRLAINWRQVERSKGSFDWTAPDIQIQRAVQRKLHLFITLGGTPQWANGRRTENYPPRSAIDWHRFVKTVVARYKHVSNIKAYGMWNEPNLRKFWTGSRQEYVRIILIPGYKAVKSVDRRLIVAGPEISHHWPLQLDWNLSEFMGEASRYIDVLTLHYYPDAPYNFAVFLDHLVKPYRKNKKVWVTEIGDVACANKRCSEATQSRSLYNFLSEQRKRSKWFKKIFPYRIWDPRDQCNKNGNGFGLTVGKTLDERHAFRTYRNFILKEPYRNTRCK